MCARNTRLDLAVLAAHALQRQEEELLGELALAPRPCCPRRRARRSPPRCIAGAARCTSWRKRRSSSVKIGARPFCLDGAALHRLLERCAGGRGASARRACPSPRARSRSRPWWRCACGLRFGSFISSQSQSTMSSTLSSSRSWISPSSVPPAAPCACRLRRAPGCSTSPGLRLCPGRRPAAPAHRPDGSASARASLHRHRTVRLLGPRHQIRAREELGQRAPSPPRAPSRCGAASRARRARRGRTTASRRRSRIVRPWFTPVRAGW